MTTTPQRRSWRRITIDPHFQYRFVGVMLLQMIVILFILAWIANAHIDRMQDIASKLPDPVSRSELDATVRQFYTLSLVLGAATVVLLIICGLYASHRLVGPVYKLKAYFRRVAAGEDPEPIRFRRKDHLDDFSNTINRALAAERGRRGAMIGTVEALDQIAERLASVGSPAAAGELLDEMNELVLKLNTAQGVEGQPS